MFESPQLHQVGLSCARVIVRTIFEVMDTAARLREARAKAGLTQSALSRLTGVPQPNISAIERGRVEPKSETVGRLMEALRERPSEVLFRKRDQVLASAEKHRLRNVRVFGSCIYGTDTAGSDVDLLVTAEAGAGLYNLAGFEVEAERILGYRVDVVDDESEGRALGRIRSDAVPL